MLPQITARSGVDEKELQAVDQEMESLIDQAVEFAQGSAEPSPGSVTTTCFDRRRKICQSKAE